MESEESSLSCDENDPDGMECSDATPVSETVAQRTLRSESGRNDEDFQGNFKFYDLNCDTVMLVLRRPCTLHFYGSFSAKCLAGLVEIFGYIVDSGKPPVQVYSCEGSSALYMCTLNKEMNNVELDISMISNLGVSFMEATKICNIVKSGGCILLLNDVERKRYMREKMGRAERRFGLSLDTPYRRIKNRVNVNSGIKLDLNSGITVLCGGQGVGKSTTLRYLTNRTLNSVRKLLYIDLDIGQPEFTLHECVSAIIVDKPIIGPSYTHFRRPVFSYNVGNIDASRCVDTYIRAVELLVEKCLASYSDIPWLVNTMGFSKGVGVYITSSCLAILNPSLVIQIDGDKSKNFPSDLTVDYVESVSKRAVSNYDLVKVIKDHKVAKDFSHRFTHTNKEIRWISTENYFKDDLRPSYPLTVPAEFLKVFNVITKSVISTQQYSNLVSKIIILSSSFSLDEPPQMLDYGMILSYMEDEKVFLVLTPIEPGESVMSIESFLVGSLQVPGRLNKAVDPCTSGLVPYTQVSKLGKSAPTVKPLKRTYRFLFEPSFKPPGDSQTLNPVT